jgi:hypothetical protein
MACEVDAELGKKPEFKPLRQPRICSQSVDIRSVGITSENTREIVFVVATRYYRHYFSYTFAYIAVAASGRHR